MLLGELEKRKNDEGRNKENEEGSSGENLQEYVQLIKNQETIIRELEEQLRQKNHQLRQGVMN